MDPVALQEHASRVYRAVKGVSGILATVQGHLETLASDLLDPETDRLEVTSFTLNSQTASGELRLTRADQLELLTLVKAQLEAGGELRPGMTQPVF
jgi:hypothetical protein